MKVGNNNCSALIPRGCKSHHRIYAVERCNLWQESDRLHRVWQRHSHRHTAQLRGIKPSWQLQALFIGRLQTLEATVTAIGDSCEHCALQRFPKGRVTLSRASKLDDLAFTAATAIERRVLVIQSPINHNQFPRARRLHISTRLLPLIAGQPSPTT